MFTSVLQNFTLVRRNVTLVLRPQGATLRPLRTKSKLGKFLARNDRAKGFRAYQRTGPRLSPRAVRYLPNM